MQALISPVTSSGRLANDRRISPIGVGSRMTILLLSRCCDVDSVGPVGAERADPAQGPARFCLLIRQRFDRDKFSGTELHDGLAFGTGMHDAGHHIAGDVS